MSSVVLNQKSGNDQVYATGVLTGTKGVVSKGAISSQSNIVATGQSGVVAGNLTAGTNATLYVLDNNGTTGGGLEANHLQIYGYFDPAVTLQTIQEFADIYPAPVGGTAPALTTTPVFRTNNSIPLNWGAPWIGSTTGTGAAVVVPVAGIATNATIRLYLVGFVGAAGATAVVPPTFTIQPNVSFTITATTGAIYNYEVLQA